jgi:hypothetical protein
LNDLVFQALGAGLKIVAADGAAPAIQGRDRSLCRALMAIELDFCK